MANNKLNLPSSPIIYLTLILFLKFISCFAEEKSIYLVIVEGDPVAFHGASSLDKQGKRVTPNSEISKAHAKHLVDSHDQLLQSTLQNGTYTKLYSFKHIINGFSIHTTSSQAKKLKSSAGVKVIEKDRGVKSLTTYTPKFLGLPDGVWTQKGGDRNAGEGIVIGFVDSGINPLHPSFAYDPTNPFNSSVSHFSGDCETGPQFPASSCNGKIVSARFFSAGAQAVATLNSSVDFLSPFDAVGHGSHVASTAAGNDGVPVVVNGFFYGRATGMAPQARIAVYKAIYPTLGTLTDVVAAIDQATLDGVDILTLSVGPDAPPEDTITFLNVFEISLLFARRAGIFVVQAAGNHGPDRSTVVSFSPWAMGVAACNTDRSYPGTLFLGNGQKVGGIGLSGLTFGNGKFQYKLVLAKDAVKVSGTFPRTTPYIEECQYTEPFDPNIVQGSVVICTFSSGFLNGTSTLDAIIATAKVLGFSGFILVANPSYGSFLAEPIPFVISGILIPKVTDVEIITRYYERQTERDENGCVTKFGARAAIGEGRVESIVGRAPIVSRFSSRGPDFIDTDRNPTDVLKPDILAPGHQIWAAWSPMSALDSILTGYNFALVSGTSMATPHVAGIAALIKQHNPSWTPSMISSAISTTARKYDNFGDLLMAEAFDLSLYSSTPFEFGAGLIDATRALDPGLVLPSEFEDYIGFLCSLPNIDPEIIKASTGGLCTHSINHPSDLNLPSITISALTGSLLVRRYFRNVGSKTETYLSSVLRPNGTVVTLNPPWFTIAPHGTHVMEIQFNVTKAIKEYSFGEIVLTGSLNHIVRMAVSVFPVSIH